MSIYLVDFENVTSEGLSGVSRLSEEDKVILFYSTKANKISMPIHVEMSKSLASFEYKEVLVGGKNALDYQLSTYLGYLIGQKEDTNYYIVSKDKGYEYLSDFWKQTLGETKQQISIEHIGAIKAAKSVNKIEAIHEEQEEKEDKIVEAISVQESKLVLEPTNRETKEAEVAFNKKFNSPNKRNGMKSTYHINRKKPVVSEAQNVQKTSESKNSIVVKENAFSYNEKVVKGNQPNIEVEKQLRQLIDKELQEDQVKRIVQYFKQAKNKQELHRKIVKVLGQDRGTVIYHKIKRLIKK